MPVTVAVALPAVSAVLPGPVMVLGILSAVNALVIAKLSAVALVVALKADPSTTTLGTLANCTPIMWLSVAAPLVCPAMSVCAVVKSGTPVILIETNGLAAIKAFT